MAICNKQTCPTCGQSVNERQITLFSGMVTSLWRVFMWCHEHNKWEFQRKEIKHLFSGSDNQIARFGDWILFGGLVYRPEGRSKGWYGIHRTRAFEFFTGKRSIPTSIWKNPLTKELKPEDYRTIGQIKSLENFIDENGEYIAKYRMPDDGGQFTMF